MQIMQVLNSANLMKSFLFLAFSALILAAQGSQAQSAKLSAGLEQDIKSGEIDLK